jgi:hypothetical protein
VAGSHGLDDDRDYLGYGASPPDPQWPGDARIALNINVNFEGGGEHSIMDLDAASEGALNDIGQPALPGLRSVLVESRGFCEVARHGQSGMHGARPH